MRKYTFTKNYENGCCRLRLSAHSFNNKPHQKISMITTPKPFVPEYLNDEILVIKSGDNYQVESSKYNLSSCAKTEEIQAR